jgi:predicted RNase H-like HicB family nuclease
VSVPIVIEQEEDGVWCAHAQLRPGLGAHGEGDTEEAAGEDLREALTALIEEFGVPRELPITVAAWFGDSRTLVRCWRISCTEPTA